jgi:hypothetical protein
LTLIALAATYVSSWGAPFVPPGLQPGDSYHLAFLTAGVHDAISADIAVYNAFVQKQAELNPAATGTDVGVKWYAIASTEAVDARDNALVSAPVYLFNAFNQLKVADGYADMWDGDLQLAIARDQYGIDKPPTGDPDLVWTGSIPDGTAYSYPLGSGGLGMGGGIGVGEVTRTDRWMHCCAGVETTLHELYALSEKLVVPIPEPSSGTMCLLFALAAAAMTKRSWAARSLRA